MKKRNVYLSIGSNIGDKEYNLNLAIVQIEKSIGNIVKVSNFYSNPAEGFIGEFFLNACLHIESNLSPSDLINSILKIENLFGRKRKAKGFYESRNIDIDIIFVEDIVLKTQSLTIPHPRMHTRHFVLIPLCEISKDIFHPIKKKTVHELLLALPERLDIIKVNS